MTPTTLLILAAGLGTRYGGLKQLDPVGPSGELRDRQEITSGLLISNEG